MKQTELFASEPAIHPLGPLSERLWELARRGVYFGSSSWKYESWKGSVYVETYRSKKDFEQNCLEEYARIFPAVGGDFSFYNWPGEEMLERIAKQTPDGFKIGLKATEFVTLKRFPQLGRWGEKAGQDNPDFLNAKLFSAEFLKRVDRLGDKLAPIILEFTAFPRGAFAHWVEFAEQLQTFLNELRRRHGDRFDFGVEVRTREYVHEDFWEALLAMGAAPIINSWTRTPPMDEQWKLFERHEFPFIESRPVMRPGRTRDEAVVLFEPYADLRETEEPSRRAMRAMARWALERKRPCYVFVNNHLEGCAWRTIDAVTATLSQT
jgi:uncharacterized protein YecE (DUF72 family)